jgi:phosphoribosyl-ATP pyrophosphohydrolase/phosphoribosyl-AMP cyclohydrolase
VIAPSTINWQKSPDGLLPVIIQDDRTGRVLMLGFMNEDALKRTLQTSFVTFFSRSKRRLWEKGETSANRLKVASITSDCDLDALLIRAIPEGPTCHTGAISCFSADETALETLGTLIETIRSRSSPDAPERSYTRSLLIGGVEACGAKVLEETKELVRAAKSEGRTRTIEEAADLLYHMLVLLRGQGIELHEVADELQRRQ